MVTEIFFKMIIAVYGSQVNPEQISVIKDVFKLLSAYKTTTYVYGPYLDQIRDVVDVSSVDDSLSTTEDLIDHDVEYVLCLGGDGTILKATTWVMDSNIPLVGINLGRMGFLASWEKKTLPSLLDNLKSNQYRREERSLLQVKTDPDIFGEKNFALNDITLLKNDQSNMITIDAHVDGDFLNTYWADGLIISTPTGSTGYSLSCGGPIVSPTNKNFILTAVAPHNLTTRPIVIPDDVQIDLRVSGRADSFLISLDSRSEAIHSDYKIGISKCPFTIILLSPPDMSFAKRLRKKLMWGSDIRKSDK